MKETVRHTIAPVYDSHSRILILGTMPSPKSREAGFYYGHPQNRFWRVLSQVLQQPLPETLSEKRELLLNNRIALWDVLAECRIQGASDASIADAVPSDIPGILREAPIHSVFTTGAAAEKLYRRLIYPLTGVDCIRLPSTSPANCAVRLEQLVETYRQLLHFLR